jgi:iron complex outermembrane recepter protein
MKRLGIYRARMVVSSLAFVAVLNTAPLFAQNVSSEDEAKPGEIIVTAQRRAQNIQDVPAAVTALSAEQLSTRQIEDTNDLQTQIPNVVISTGTGTASSARIFFRGVGEDESRGAIDPAVGIYLDGVYLGRTVGSLVDLVDTKQIEVLRGPQGTLYGRNTIGGAIKINSVEPKVSEYSLDGQIGLGSDNRVSFKTSLNAGLSDTTALRISGLYKKRDGFFKQNPTGAFANLRNDNLGKENVFAIRASLLQNLGEDWSALFSFDKTIDRTQPTPSSILAKSRNPTVLTDFDGNIFTVEPGRIAATPTLQVVCSAATPAIFRPIGCFTDFRSRVDSTGISLKLEGDLGSFKLMSLSAYRTLKDNLSTHISFPFTQQTDQNQFSQEILLSSDLEGPFNFVAGAYYYDEDVVLNSVFTAPTRQQVNTKSIAIFSQGTFNVTDKLSLTGGLRYTDEKRDFAGRANPIPAPGTVTRQVKTNNLTYTAKVDYSFTDDILIYGSYATGAKSPGFASDCFSAAVCFQPVAEENLDSIEVGLRTEFFDRRAQFNLTYFNNKYQDLQISATLPTGGFSRANAGEAKIQGIEVETSFRPVDGLSLYAHGSWLDAKYGTLTLAQSAFITQTRLDTGVRGVSCVNATATPGTPAFNDQIIACAKGLSLKNAPKWKGTIGFDYSASLASGKLSFGGDLSYESDSFALVANNPGSLLEPGVRINARVGYKPDNGSWSIALWGKNLTDRTYYRATTGVNQVYPAPPLTWGVDLGFSF